MTTEKIQFWVSANLFAIALSAFLLATAGRLYRQIAPPAFQSRWPRLSQAALIATRVGLDILGAMSALVGFAKGEVPAAVLGEAIVEADKKNAPPGSIVAKTVTITPPLDHVAEVPPPRPAMPPDTPHLPLDSDQEITPVESPDAISSPHLDRARLLAHLANPENSSDKKDQHK